MISIQDIQEAIKLQKSGKSPVADAIKAEWLKADQEWWAHLLYIIFDTVNRTGQIPANWRKAIIIPIYKKGDAKVPANFRPISLLSIPGKVYARCLLFHLQDWIDQHRILGLEQIGFRKGRSTLDHAIVLLHLAHKYSVSFKSKLFVAFLDLKAAFDSVDRNLLWKKLLHMGIDKELLCLIQRLYTDTSCQIRLTQDRKLTEEIPTNRGVKQGCLLAPTLFNLFLNDMAAALDHSDCHPPKLGSRRTALLLYADDAVLLSQTRRGLFNLINKSLAYFTLNKLQLNFTKSKIMVFAKTWSPHRWTFANGVIDQVKTYKYLGIHFSYNLTWITHRNAALNAARMSLHAILRFFYKKGGATYTSCLEVIQGQSPSPNPIWMPSMDGGYKEFNRTTTSPFSKENPRSP